MLMVLFIALCGCAGNDHRCASVAEVEEAYSGNGVLLYDGKLHASILFHLGNRNPQVGRLFLSRVLPDLLRSDGFQVPDLVGIMVYESVTEDDFALVREQDEGIVIGYFDRLNPTDWGDTRQRIMQRNEEGQQKR